MGEFLHQEDFVYVGLGLEHILQLLPEGIGVFLLCNMVEYTVVNPLPDMSHTLVQSSSLTESGLTPFFSNGSARSLQFRKSSIRGLQIV